MTWYPRQRQEWIADMLRVYGFINRHHLIRKFGISKPQASNDLSMFQHLNPKVIFYDPSSKCYRATKR